MISEYIPKRGMGGDKLPRNRDLCHIPALTDDSRPGDSFQADLADLQGITTHSDIIDYLTPFSIGVGLVDDQFGVIVEKGCTYPCENRDIFTSAHNLQTSITLPIYQGENLVANENVLLGVLRIDDLVPELQGRARIEVTIILNQHRILQAWARDLKTKRMVTTTIRSTDLRLSRSERNTIIQNDLTMAMSMLERYEQESADYSICPYI